MAGRAPKAKSTAADSEPMSAEPVAEGSSTPTSSTPDLSLGMSIQYVPGVGPRRAVHFRKLGIESVGDLLRHIPHRYEFEQEETPIGGLHADTLVSTRGEVLWARPVRHGRRPRFEAEIEDDSGRLTIVWFNATYLRDRIHPGLNIRVTGKTKRYRNQLQMVNPRWEEVVESDESQSSLSPASSHEPNGGQLMLGSGESGESEMDVNPGRFKPVYHATAELPSDFIARIVQSVLHEALPLVQDHFTDPFRKVKSLPALADAIRMAHEPRSEDEVAKARRRMVYDELLMFQVGLAMQRHRNETDESALSLESTDEIDARIRRHFPFELTSDQNRSIDEIRADVARSSPMNRLLQGDVGSGKTAVALYAMLLAVASRTQAAIMAPTEILAEQHYLSVSSFLRDAKVRVDLLTGRMSAAERESVCARIAQGDVDIVIGTHALLSERIRFHRLGLIVIDEQHRFGVEQRAAMREAALRDPLSHEESPSIFERDSQCTEKSELKPTIHPHVLVMTATPIPRTLAMTLFGDLEISTIRESPPGRSPIITRVVTQNERDQVYEYVAERLRQGEQAYIVLPAIDESSTAELRHVREQADWLANGPFQDLRIAQIHGRLKRETRARVMERFRQNKINALVATTVIEVGVDVPNATVMVVEHAERYGLSQLHQLRGRVGRGSQKSLCVYIGDPTTDDAHARLDAVRETSDGFEIAEKDFEIRGMGEIFGTKQSGGAPFRLAQFPSDFAMLQSTRKDATQMVRDDPAFDSTAENQLLYRRLVRKYGEFFGFVDVA